MSLDDLEQAGITLPRDQWGKSAVRPAMKKLLFSAAAVAAIASAGLMYWGNGGIVTWAGALLFLAGLSGATVVSLRAVAKQCGPSGTKNVKPQKGRPTRAKT